MRRTLVLGAVALGAFAFALGFAAAQLRLEERGSVDGASVPSVELRLRTGADDDASVFVFGKPPFSGTVEFEILWRPNATSAWSTVVERSVEVSPGEFRDEGGKARRILIGRTLDCSGTYRLIGHVSIGQTLVPALEESWTDNERTRSCDPSDV